MTSVVVVLRIVPLLAFAIAMCLAVPRHQRGAKTRSRESSVSRAPLVANFAAFGLYAASLLVFSRPTGSAALWLASSGALLAVAGAAVVVRSRSELGAAWSLVPRADPGAGLVTTGPYGYARHPIYLGFLLFAIGEALAFDSGPAVMIALFGVAPTFAWRARTEEECLRRTFGDRYTVYQQRTRIIVPYLL